MGVYNRTFLGARGLIPRDGCAPKGEIVVWASGKSRAIKTAESFVEGLQPGCGIVVDHPESEDNDPVFHPAEGIDGAIALKAAERQKPGVHAEARAHTADFAVLQRVLGCDPTTKAGCDIAKRPSEPKGNKDDSPDVEGALSIASTGGQTVLLEYVEGKPMDQVGWGRASKADIQAMLRFHPVKFHYEVGAPYIAERYAAPIAKRLLSALNGEADTGRLTLLVGHDTNIAALRGFFGAHFTAADYPQDDPPPGGAMGFELLKDSGGHAFVRAFYHGPDHGPAARAATADRRQPAILLVLPDPGLRREGRRHGVFAGNLPEDRRRQAGQSGEELNLTC